MPRGRLAVTAGISAVVGAGIFFIVGFILHIFNFALPAVPSNPNDSPVTVRGGSVVTQAPPMNGSNPWTCSSATACQATLPEPAVLESIDGVSLPGGPIIPQTVNLSISTNWKVTFTFRDSTGQHNDPTKALEVCTNSDCSVDTNQAGNTLYLVGDGNGTFSDQILDRYGKRYDLKVCGQDKSGNPEAACNHIFSIEVNSKSTTSPNETYQCDDGDCTLGIGALPTSIKRLPQ